MIQTGHKLVQVMTYKSNICLITIWLTTSLSMWTGSQASCPTMWQSADAPMINIWLQFLRFNTRRIHSLKVLTPKLAYMLNYHKNWIHQTALAQETIFDHVSQGLLNWAPTRNAVLKLLQHKETTTIAKLFKPWIGTDVHPRRLAWGCKLQNLHHLVLFANEIFSSKSLWTENPN